MNLPQLVGGTGDYPIFRVSESALDGTVQVSYELHARSGLHCSFATLEHAEQYVTRILAELTAATGVTGTYRESP